MVNVNRGFRFFSYFLPQRIAKLLSVGVERMKYMDGDIYIKILVGIIGFIVMMFIIKF